MSKRIYTKNNSTKIDIQFGCSDGIGNSQSLNGPWHMSFVGG
jgi:hypothetical protein